MTHVRVWKFRPRQGREEEFAIAYGPGGSWAALFGQARGYLGTDLHRPAQGEGWWLTIDRWNNQADFEAFSQEFGEEYRRLDSELEDISGDEEFVGAFEED